VVVKGYFANIVRQDGSKDNKHYYYTMGWNVQGVIAYLAGIALPFPGFVGTLGAKVSLPAQNMGHIGWLLSFTTSFVLYWLICLVWPTQNQKMVRELGLGFEEESYKEIVAVDGTVIADEQEGYPDQRFQTFQYDEKYAGAFIGDEDSPTRK
jgi:NCS1 family nucleobase:cation symporter-1